jgi:hypothetical protein
MYPPDCTYDVARAHQAALREEVAQHRMTRQARTARRIPRQPRGDALLERRIGVVARLRALVVA